MINFVYFFKAQNPSPLDGIGSASDEDTMLQQETEETGILPISQAEFDSVQSVGENSFILQNGELVAKAPFGITVDVTGTVVTVSNLPADGYELFVDMGEPVGLVAVTEPQFELVDPGEYAIVLRPSFPYAEERHHVEIV